MPKLRGKKWISSPDYEISHKKGLVSWEKMN